MSGRSTTKQGGSRTSSSAVVKAVPADARVAKSSWIAALRVAAVTASDVRLAEVAALAVAVSAVVVAAKAVALAVTATLAINGRFGIR